MRLVFCCEFYHPSVGGVQEVVRQVGERLVKFGHEVVVATTRLTTRSFAELNGVQIRESDISGNRVRGIRGQVEAYRNFIVSCGADAILINAAQQWTFDAVWPILGRIKWRMVFIPCGLSGLYEPASQRYFQELPGILRRLDRLIFHAESYRDIEF